MAQQRYCQRCADTVDCREEPGEYATTLYCPKCEKKIATLYGHIVIVRRRPAGVIE